MREKYDSLDNKRLAFWTHKYNEGDRAMSDIVKLLLRECDHQLAFGNDMSDVLLPAAAEIARFRAENERLRAGLQKIVDAEDAPSLARDLLEGKDIP